MTNRTMASRVAGLLNNDGSNLKDINDHIQYVGGVAGYYQNVKTVTEKGPELFDPGRLEEVWIFADSSFLFADGDCWDIELPADTLVIDDRVSDFFADECTPEYFWNKRYSHLLRGLNVTIKNEHRYNVCVAEMQNQVKKAFVAAGLPLDGDSAKHDEIVYRVHSAALAAVKLLQTLEE